MSVLRSEDLHFVTMLLEFERLVAPLRVHLRREFYVFHAVKSSWSCD